ncbi:MAG: cupin domain-containing protein [Candidatus Daviesbacteria bacterium]|nr:MAG: cupin domain-containing protein [Candidatus Daviesbacteria bacterium]
MKNIQKAIKSFSQKKILVVGDLMLDLYTYGTVNRISPEAPVPILLKTDEKYSPGGAANVANNLRGLGAEVAVCGIAGEDSNGERLLVLLNELGIDTKAVIKTPDFPTTLKQRLIAENRQIVRVDEENIQELNPKEQKDILTWIEFLVGKYDAIILSDYAKGVFTKNLTSEIIKLAKKHNKLITADIKPVNKSLFKGAHLIFPNLKEAEEMTGGNTINEMGAHLVKYFNCDVVITKGAEGMAVFQRDNIYFEIPGRKIEVFDVSGAGDTVIAVITLGLISNLNLNDSANLANFAGSIVVQKAGTASIKLEELEAYINIGKYHIDNVEIVPKVWGYEKWLENNSRYCSKLLFLKQDYQCSLHYHKVKDELFLVTSGHVRFELGKEIIHLMPGSFIRVPPKTLHRYRGIVDSEILEVSTHHSEKDSYRLEPSRKIEIDNTKSFHKAVIVDSKAIIPDESTL